MTKEIKQKDKKRSKSVFGYKIWRMKKWFSSNAPSVILWSGLLLAAWAVSSIELELLPKILCGFSDTTINGLNRAFLALAYSYIAGAVIYGMTVKYPEYRKKQRIAPVIKAKAENLGILLSNMNTEFRNSNNPKLSDIDAVMALFTTQRWRERCLLPEHSICKNVTDGFIQDFREFRRVVDSFINDYKDILSTDQLIYLEAIRSSPLDQYFGTYEKRGKNYNYSDAFYEKIFPPLYKDLILIYYGLAMMCGVDLSKM
ncbi:MAG: hypothetical protein IKP54_04405 [Bacteroidales bacterium]|nr:hypothetical protein [Bacteroidales bacterium]